MTRARDVSRLVTTPPNIYATDTETSSAGYLTNDSASSTYQTKALNQFAHRNLVINGDMQVAQRSTSVASITTGDYRTVDRWTGFINNLGTWTQSVENDAPTGSGFRKSLKMLCTTADASPAASDVCNFFTTLEGQNLQQIAKGTSSAKELTVSFWVKANVTGTYVVELYDNDNTRHMIKQYTISSSATWEKKTLTFPADTTGAFDNDNNGSLNCIFYLSSGSDRTSGTLLSSWASVTNANRAVGQTNLASAINNYWQVTGVQLEVGDTATPFEFKSVEDELVECQRYFWRGYVSGGGVWGGSGGTVPLVSWVYPVKMRTTPAWAWISGGIASNGNAGYTVTGVVTSSIQIDSALLGFSISGSTGANTQGCAVYDSLNSFNAEL
jgi:hypothetical protein